MGLKVYDLRCSGGHRFEGWFASEDDYRSQGERKLLACPMCEDTAIERLPSAARLNVSGAQEPQAALASSNTPTPAAPGNPMATMQASGVDLQALWLQAVRHVMANTEDVGERFADEARDIHHGRSPQRGIRGQATPAEAAELREEGIEVHSLPVPKALTGPVQ